MNIKWTLVLLWQKSGTFSIICRNYSLGKNSNFNRNLPNKLKKQMGPTMRNYIFAAGFFVTNSQHPRILLHIRILYCSIVVAGNNFIRFSTQNVMANQYKNTWMYLQFSLRNELLLLSDLSTSQSHCSWGAQKDVCTILKYQLTNI